MKKSFTLLSLGIITSLLLWQSTGNYVHSNNNGAPAGHTGSPADGQTCSKSTCHVTTPAQPSAVQIMSSNIPVTGYVPGTQYTITAICTSGTGSNKFGFQISPQSATGTYLGTLLVTNTNQTKIVLTKYITHTQNGNLGIAGIKSWSFDWIAPAAGTGNVTFYGAFNYANGSNTASGDLIRTNTLVVAEDLTVGLNELPHQIASTIYPNPVLDNATFEFELETAAKVHLKILDAMGRVLQNDIVLDGVPGLQSTNLSIPSSWPSGVYKVCLEAGNQQSVRNFIKQ